MFTWLRRNGSFSRAHSTPGITSTTWSWPGWFSQGYRSASAEEWMASVLLCILNAYRDLRRYASRKSREGACRSTHRKRSVPPRRMTRRVASGLRRPDVRQEGVDLGPQHVGFPAQCVGGAENVAGRGAG